MNIYRLYLEDFYKRKDDIQILMEESFRHNFPEQEIGNDYYETTLGRIEEYLQNHTAVIFLAQEEEKVCGWLWSHEILRFTERRLHIANIAVCPRMQGKGIGRQLIDYAEKYAGDHGYDGLDLLVTKSNETAVHFYGKNGFEVERFLMKKDV